MIATIRPNTGLEHFHTPCCSLRVKRHASLPSQHWVYSSKHTILIQHIYRNVCKASSLNDSAPPAVSVFPITGDGACLFRALAQGSHLASSSSSTTAPSPLQSFFNIIPLSKDEESSQALLIRTAICDELVNRQDDIAPFIDADFSSYINAMRNPSTWGGEPELSVAPHVLKIPVFVYTITQQKELQLVSIYDGDGEYTCSSNSITLLFRKFGHYDLLVQSFQSCNT
jgi:hypothetical protein